jgi:phasin family protein
MATKTSRRPARKTTRKPARKAATSAKRGAARTVEPSALPGITLKAILESQRKDLEALAQANHEVYEGMKALAKRNNEMLRHSLVQWRVAIKQVRGKGALGRQVAFAQQGIKQAIANFRELAEMEAATRRKAWKVLQDRVQANVAQLQMLIRRR